MSFFFKASTQLPRQFTVIVCSHKKSQAKTLNYFPLCVLELWSHMYGLSMEPQYENGCNCCVASLFSLSLTPRPDLYLSIFCCPFPPLSTPPRSLALRQFICRRSLPGVLFPRSPAASKVWFTPALAVKREAFVSHQQKSHGTLHGGRNKNQNPAVSPTLLYKSTCLCGWKKEAGSEFQRENPYKNMISLSSNCCNT